MAITADDIKRPEVRRYIVKQYGYIGFCLVYLSHYFYLEPADYHPDMLSALGNELDDLLELIGHRSSAKSTGGSLALPLYLALEEKFHFILPIADTGDQLKLNIAAIRYELENNPLILADYGQRFAPQKGWSERSLLLSAAKKGDDPVLILGPSRGQKVRGMKHLNYRPQVCIIDDPEDIAWVKEKKNRDKTFRWLTSEVIPAQQEDKFKLVLIGNLLHPDALMMRVKKLKRADGSPLFKCLEFPLIRPDEGRGLSEWERCTWKAKYPTPEALQRQKEKVASPSAWAREYLLKIIPEEDQIIKEDDIQRYPNTLLTTRDQNGRLGYKLLDAGVGNDLAISEKTTADFVAFVAGYKVEWDGKHLLILPNPVNKHMDFDGTVKTAENLYRGLPMGTKFYVEDVMYQRAALQTYKKKGISVIPVRPVSDKRARLEAAAPFIKDGTVLFPESGCEELLDQLINFGSVEHDDLVDALVYLILALINKPVASGGGKVDAL